MTWIDALKHDADARRSFESWCAEQIADAVTMMRTAVLKNDIPAAARAEGRTSCLEKLRDDFTAQERQEAQRARYRAADPAR
jgi:hypothetical protein